MTVVVSLRTSIRLLAVARLLEAAAVPGPSQRRCPTLLPGGPAESDWVTCSPWVVQHVQRSCLLPGSPLQYLTWQLYQRPQQVAVLCIALIPSTLLLSCSSLTTQCSAACAKQGLSTQATPATSGGRLYCGCLCFGRIHGTYELTWRYCCSERKANTRFNCRRCKIGGRPGFQTRSSTK